MKLKELAEVRLGIRIAKNLIIKEIRPIGSFYQYIQASDFEKGQSSYVSLKDLKKNQDFSNRVLLQYGDYILYKRETKYALLRYENISGQTVPGDGLIIISTDISILKDFFSSEKNRKYFCFEIQKIEQTDGALSIAKIGAIEIMTDNIMELEDSNKAEQIGIRKPISITDLPFRIVQKPITIDKLLKRIKYNELLLDTEFQRRPGLWDIPTKSRLIESMIIRLPIPAFYFDGGNDSEWLVIDGLQRLSAVNDFVNNKFSLVELDYLSELEGKTFDDLDRQHQRNIEEYEVFAYILEKDTPKSVTYKIFKNINTSALKLEPQEIRHAINPGIPAQYLKEIAEEEWFKRALLITDRQRDRMDDRELALRFIAFQTSGYSDFRPTVGEFLDQSMTQIYDIPSFKRALYKKDLEDIVTILYELFGNKAFSRSLFDSTRNYGHNTILYELLTYGLSLWTVDRRKTILDKNSDFSNKVKSHFSSKPDRFWDFESAYTVEGLRKRFEEVEQLFKTI